MAEGQVCGQYTTHEGGGWSGGVLSQKILKFEERGNAISCILRSKFVLKFMLTILVFEIKEGKNAQKVKKNINHNLSLLIRGIISKFEARKCQPFPAF
jgi:hypothetical protein